MLYRFDTGDVSGFEVITAHLGDRSLRLALADTPLLRSRGLMGVTSLGDLDGMLFSWDTAVQVSFWMKNTLIPLDILYLDSSGAVVDVQTMTPQPGVPDSELARYPSAAPARYAIEMNAGLAQEYGIKPGVQALFR